MARSRKFLSTDRMLDLWASGYDTFEIAHRYGLPEHEVYNRVARFAGGVEPREDASGNLSQSSHGGALAPLSSPIGATPSSFAGTEKSTDEDRKIRTT